MRLHPDVVLLDAREPHKKFVEKVSRDYLVHGMVPYYAVAEIRTRADTIVQKTGLTKTAEDLLTVSKADEPEAVTDANTLTHRVHALFMTISCSFGSGVCFASRVLAFKGVFVSLTPVSHMEILRTLSQDFSKQHHRHHSLTREAKTQQEHPA